MELAPCNASKQHETLKSGKNYKICKKNSNKKDTITLKTD